MTVFRQARVQLSASTLPGHYYTTPEIFYRLPGEKVKGRTSEATIQLLRPLTASPLAFLQIPVLKN